MSRRPSVTASLQLQALNRADLQAQAQHRDESDSVRALRPETPIEEEVIELHQGGEYLDGGYGWVITACAFTLCFQNIGILYAWGVFQARLSHDKLADSVTLSSIGGVAAFCVAFGSLPASWCLARLGPRYSALIGVILSSVGLLLAGFTTASVPGLIVTWGVMFGIGGGLVFLPAYTLPSQFFLKKRGLSTGIASCGGGLGGAVWSVLAERLIAAWGIAWAFRFLGFASLVLGLPAVYLLRPGYIAPRSDVSHASREKGIFKSSRYIRLLVACCVASYPFFIPPYYIPQYAQSIGLSASQGALYAALFNVASGIGRIAFGILADVLIGSINAWTISMTTIALSSLLIWPNATTQGIIILFVILCGLGSGGFFSLQSSVVGQIIGSHRVPLGIGFIEVAMSFGNLAGPISAGALLDAFGGVNQGAGPYKPAIYLVGGTTTVAVLIVASVRFSTSRILWGKI